MRDLKGIKKLLSLLVFAGLVGVMFYAYERGSRSNGDISGSTPLPYSGNSPSRVMPAESPRSVTPEPKNVQNPPNTVTALPPAPAVQEVTPPPPKEPRPKLNKEEFRSLVKLSIKTLPRSADLKKSKDVHHMPAIVFQKARSMMTIAGAVDANPALEEDAIVYYKKCVDTPDIVLSIRGRCLANYKRLGAKHGIQVNLKDYPPELANLAEFVP